MIDVQKKYNSSSIIISHDMNCIDITANRVIMLIDGTRYAEDTFQQLHQSRDERIKEFFE